MNRVKKVISTTMVVTMIGSAISFFRSSAAPWLFAIKTAPLFAVCEKEDGGETAILLRVDETQFRRARLSPPDQEVWKRPSLTSAPEFSMAVMTSSTFCAVSFTALAKS